MNLEPIFVREDIIKCIREYWYAQGFHEIIPSTFNTAIPLEPNIYPFETSWNTIHGLKQFFLSTSPESGLKKMMANGVGNCFAISKAFRNLEDVSNRHIPEFLMLEWYRTGNDYVKIMDESEHLIKWISNHMNKLEELVYMGEKIQIDTPWPRYSMVELFDQYAKVSLDKIIDDTTMLNVSSQKKYSTEGATWEQLFHQIFLNEIEPNLGVNPCFVVDFPARISPLCRPKNDDPRYAERFELYIAGMELGNGNTENTDEKSVRKVFAQEKEKREQMNISTLPVDEAFLSALESLKNVSFAGMGLGIDRLAMIFSDSKTIQEVEPLF